MTTDQPLTCANCHRIIVAEEGDTCASIPLWKRMAFTYCDETPDPEPPTTALPVPCATCHEYSDPAWDRTAIEPQLPSVSTPAMRYTSVYCPTCKQVNRATGRLLGMERPYQHCCVAGCPSILPTEQMVLDRGYYCPEHAPQPPTCAHCEQAPATDSSLCTPCATLPEPPCGHPNRSHFCVCECDLCNAIAAQTAAKAAAKFSAARQLAPIAGGSLDCDTLDRHAVRELDLYAENTSELYRQFQAIIANLRRKIARGTYDAALAPKLWRYWYDAAAKRYQTDVCPMRFPPAVRQACAEQRATDEYQKIINGEYDPPAEHVEVCHACHSRPATRRDPFNTARQLCPSCAITASQCRGW